MWFRRTVFQALMCLTILLPLWFFNQKILKKTKKQKNKTIQRILDVQHKQTNTHNDDNITPPTTTVGAKQCAFI